jgi:acylphosphatase
MNLNITGWVKQLAQGAVFLHAAVMLRSLKAVKTEIGLQSRIALV